MSIEYLNAAFKASVKPSSLKFVLVALADYANEVGEAYPSVETMNNKTEQDRKTIMKNYARLEELGLISDTGERKGRTKKVVVYRLHLKQIKESQKRDYSGKQSQKRNSPVFPKKEAVIVPKTVRLNSPKNGTQNHQSFNHQFKPSEVVRSFEVAVDKSTEIKNKTDVVWTAWQQSYRDKYKMDQIRSSKINGMLSVMIDAIGEDEFVRVAAFYLKSQKKFYVDRCHDLGLMFADLNSLRVEMDSPVKSIREVPHYRSVKDLNQWANDYGFRIASPGEDAYMFQQACVDHKNSLIAGMGHAAGVSK